MPSYDPDTSWQVSRSRTKAWSSLWTTDDIVIGQDPVSLALTSATMSSNNWTISSCYLRFASDSAADPDYMSLVSMTAPSSWQTVSLRQLPADRKPTINPGLDISAPFDQKISYIFIPNLGRTR
jgi:hypothetical protein